MDAEEADEIFPTVEGFPALFAFKGFLSRVGPLMQDEGRAVGEGFATLTAHKRPLPGVNALVLLEVRPVRKGFAKLTALVGLLSCVCLAGATARRHDLC